MTGAVVLLVGAGAVGARAARQLSDTPSVERVFVASRRRSEARRVADAIGRRVEAIDWMPGVSMPDVSVVAVATANPDDAVRAALEAGRPCAVVDDVPGSLGVEAVAAGVTLANGCGLAPGFSDALARHAADALDEVDEIRVARVGTGGAACEVNLRRARRARPVEVRDGELRDVKRRRGEELVWFPDPVGPIECCLVSDGVEMLQQALPTAERVTVRFGDTSERGSGPSWFRRRDPEGSWGAARVEVWGRRGSGREVLVYGAIERTATAAGTVLAVTAAGLVGALDNVLVPKPGRHGLATLVEPIGFLAELARRGVKAAAFEGVPVA